MTTKHSCLFRCSKAALERIGFLRVASFLGLLSWLRKSSWDTRFFYMGIKVKSELAEAVPLEIRQF